MTPKSTPVPVEPEPASSDEEEPTLYFKGYSHEIFFRKDKDDQILTNVSN